MIRRLLTCLLLAALALGTASCGFLPYDEDLSLALLTAGKMESVAVVGPLKLWSGDFRDREVLFLPAKTDLLAGTPLQGYLVGVGSYDVRVHTVLYGTGYYLGDQLWEPVDNSNPRRFNAAFDVAKQSDALNAYVFRGLDRLFAGWERIPAPGADTDLDLKILISAAFAPVDADTVVGAAVVPNPDPTYDEVVLLWRPVAGGGSELREALWQTDAAGGLTNPLDLRGGTLIAGLPEGLERGFYGHHAGSRRSYLSWYDSGAGRYRTFRWDDSLVASELGDMKHRVDRVLSNGQLFSYGDTSGYLYDAAGRRLTRFPLGALRLACELSDGTTSRLYFTLASWGRDRDKNDFLLIQVFSIPTEDLAGL